MKEDSDENKKKLFEEVIIDLIELIDDKIGGPIMDHPIIDDLERRMIHLLVDVLWDKMKEKSIEINDVLPWSA